MRNALAKDTLREIKKSFGRFLSIFAIVGIGVAFFAGVKEGSPVMKHTADKYYDDYNLMDIRVLTSMGLTEGDIAAIKDIEGVKGIYPTHSFDALTEVGSRQVVLKLHGIPIDNLSESNENYINRLKLEEGRLPEKSGECILEKGKIINSGIEIGSKITLTSGTSEDLSGKLKTTEFTVVGLADTPNYLSFEKGSSNIGHGSVDSFIVIPEEDFKMEVYTEALITVNGAKELNSYDDEYFKVTDKVKDALVELGKERGPLRIEEVTADARKKLEDGKREYNLNKQKYDEEIINTKKKLDDSQKELTNSELELNKQEKAFPGLIEEGKRKIAEGEKKLNDGEAEYQKNLKQLTERKNDFEKIEKAINNAQVDTKKLNRLIEECDEKLKNPDLPVIERQIIEGRKQLYQLLLKSSENNSVVEMLNLIRSQINDSDAKLKSARVELDNNKKLLESEKAKLDQSEKDGKVGFAEARNKISQGKSELKNGQEQFERGKQLGADELEAAKEKLDKGERDLNEVKAPEWYVLDRHSHYSYMDYGQAADKINDISKVFPLFFFLVAALVCLTTMTRMVDEQRSTIGTLKALGYRKWDIASKYIIYAATASLLGSIVGLGIGMVLFPTVIFNAWGIMYTLPKVQLRLDLPLCIITTIVAVLITTLAAFVAVYKELVETPSLLMRPKAPIDGKRIFLEKITFIWKRLSFTEKVTARNILRYKKRFFMTVIGIAGCTALLLAGFGIRDSISTIVSKQFGEIIKYDSSILLKNEDNLKDKEDIYLKYSEDERIESLMKIAQYNGTTSKDGEEKSLKIVVPQNEEGFTSFVSLRERSSQKPIELNDSGVVITEKLAKALKVKKGDKITVNNGNGDKGELVISNITEMYVDHYIYMTPHYYKDVFGVRSEYNNLVLKLKDTSKEVEDKLGEEIIENDKVNSVIFYSGIVENFGNTISSLNLVVVVLIISAGALAFVVLYNLTNVNISERLREIATIKVLGFYDKEVSAYVYRENILLTVIGSLVGLLLGTALHRFIMITVEFDAIMFGRNINFISYVYGVVITMIFAILVNLAMYKKLKNIPMVESLKSVE